VGVLTNQAIADGVKMVNKTAGSTRILGTPCSRRGSGLDGRGGPGLGERPPASWKMYTIGDPLSAKTKYPFRLDDEKLMYRFYEKADKAGIRNICIHKGLMPADYEQSWPGVGSTRPPGSPSLELGQEHGGSMKHEAPWYMMKLSCGRLATLGDPGGLVLPDARPALLVVRRHQPL